MKINQIKESVAIITGSSGGIGSAIVDYFKKKKWITVGIDIVKSGNTDLFYQIDLSKETDFNKYIKEIIEKYGRIDCLVNNAALQICKKWNKYTMEDWNNTINCNVKSCYLLSESCRKYLKQVNGSIINVCSVHCLASSDKMGLYALSKHALQGLTKSMSLEYIKDNIRVNCVLPGAIDTKMLRDGINRTTDPDIALIKLKNSCPYGDIGKPKNIAKAIYFLCKSDFMVGSSLVIDGGTSIQLPTE